MKIATIIIALALATTTVIAAERTGRTCLGLELDPRYCDVSMARWEAFTGEEAERVDG